MMASDDNVPSNDNADKPEQDELQKLKPSYFAWADGDVRLRAQRSLRAKLERIHAWAVWALEDGEGPRIEGQAAAINEIIDGLRVDHNRAVDLRNTVLHYAATCAAVDRKTLDVELDDVEQLVVDAVEATLYFARTLAPDLAARMMRDRDTVHAAIAKLFLPPDAKDDQGELQHRRALFMLTNVVEVEQRADSVPNRRTVHNGFNDWCKKRGLDGV